MTQAQELVALTVGLITIAGAGWTLWVKKIAPYLRDRHARETAIEHAIVGRPPILDSITGIEISPALPGIGQRMATVEQALVSLAEQSRRLADLEDEQIDHGERLDRHDERLGKLEAAAVERVVARTESTAAFRAMEAAINADPDEEAHP